MIDLETNLVHATSHRDGRFVSDASSIDFLKYVDGGWKTSFVVGEPDAADGKPAALVAGLSAMFFVPIDTDGDGAGGTALADSTLSLAMRALAPKQRVSIFVNEKPVSTIEVDTVAKRYDVNVPAAVLKLGDNRVRLTFKAAATLPGGRRSAAALEKVAFGPASLGPPKGELGIAAASAVTAGGGPASSSAVVVVLLPPPPQLASRNARTAGRRA